MKNERHLGSSVKLSRPHDKMEAQLDANGGDGDDGGLACYLVGRSSRQAGHCDPVQLAATTGTPEFGAMAAEGIGASAHDTSKEWQRDLESWLPCFGHLVCHKFHLEFLAQPPIRLRTHSSLHQSSLLKESKSGPLYMMENPVKIVASLVHGLECGFKLFWCRFPIR